MKYRRIGFPLAVTLTLTITAIAAFSFGLGAYVSHASVTLNGSGVTASSTSGNFLELTSNSSTLFSVNGSGNVGANEFYGSTVSTTPYPNLSFTSSGGLNLNAGGTNQNITLSPTGSGVTIVNDLVDGGGQVYNVEAYGVVGNGTTDDTAAIQSLLNQFSDLGSGCKSGTIYFPVGQYKISNTLYYRGNNGCSLQIEGGVVDSRGGTGSTLVWDGSAGKPMFLMIGANNTHVQNLEFNLNNTAEWGLYATDDTAYSGTFTQAISPGTQTVAVSDVTSLTDGTWLQLGSGSNFEVVQVTALTSSTITATFAYSHPAGTAFGGGPGSSGLSLAYDGFINMGSGATGLELGNPTAYGTPQVSEITVDNTDFAGSGCRAGIAQSSSGNTKNMWIKNTSVNGCEYGFNINDSGNYTVIGGGFGGITVADILTRGELTVMGTESEDQQGAVFISNGGGASSVTTPLTLINNSWQTPPPATGYVVDWNGAMTMINNQFGNYSTGGYVAKVNSTGGGGAAGFIFSEGNEYANASGTYAPIYMSNDAAFPEWYTGHTPLNITSLNDIGFHAGVPTQLAPISAWTTLLSSTGPDASTGFIRAASSDAIMFRNNANTGDVNGLSEDSSDTIQVGGSGGIRLGTSTSDPTWTYGSSTPSGTCTTGSLYTNTVGSSSTTLYVCSGGTWLAK